MHPIRLTLVIITLAFTTKVVAQEELVDLRHNQHLVKASKNTNIDASRGVQFTPFIYVFDTLDLPFFDDFTTNRIKVYDAKQNDENVSLKIDYDFSVNGQNPVTLEFMRSLTYSETKEIGGNIVYSPNPELHIVYYTEGVPVGADTGWTNVITKFDEGTGLVTYDTLLADEMLINDPDTFYVVADDKSLWTPKVPIDTGDTFNSIPFINNSFARNKLTQGVATFDGTDEFGFPYDVSIETSYGLADILESKPLGLDSLMEDIYLSFVYQSGGHGNLPDEGDSLIVEFFDVVDGVWRHAWTDEGGGLNDSVFSPQVFLSIEGPKFQRAGFKFRFKNYSTLSASLDHWHIDYVRVGQDRDTTRDDTIKDVAFTEGIRSFLAPYTSVPYAHYKASPLAFEADDVAVEYINLGSDPMNLVGLKYQIYNDEDSMIFQETTADPNVSPFTRVTSLFQLSNEQHFTSESNKIIDFKIECKYTATGEGNAQTINDTIKTRQRFHNYFSYDDGTAEKAYVLTGAGLELAYKFYAPISDTLKSITFNFPQTLHNQNDNLPLRLMVWSDLNQDAIFESSFTVIPAYTQAGEFVRFELEEPLVLQDTFYIGFRQQEATKVYIGYDLSQNTSNKLFYRTGNIWYQSSFNGSLMMRADFGDELIQAGIDIPISNSLPVTVFPNPATDVVNARIGGFEPQFTEVLDLSGKVIKSANGGTVSTTSLSSGFYLMRLHSDENEIRMTKFLITH